MAIEKRPVKVLQTPEYPELKKSKIKRRRFLTLVGAVASASLLPRCYDSEDSSEPGPNGPDAGGTDTDTNGWQTDMAGGEVMPDLYDLRIPAEGEASIFFDDGARVNYVVWLQYENSDFEGVAETWSPRLLVAVDEYLRENHNGQSLSTDQGVSQAGSDLLPLLEKAAENNAGLWSVRFEVTKIEHDIDTEVLGGDVAVELFDMRLPSAGSSQVVLAGGTQIGLVVWMQHEIYDFQQYAIQNSSEFLKEAEGAVAAFTQAELEDSQGNQEATAAVQKAITLSFKQHSGYEPHIYSTRLEIS